MVVVIGVVVMTASNFFRFDQNIFLCLFFSVSAEDDEQFPLIRQCLVGNNGAHVNQRNVNFCLEYGGGLQVRFPRSICPNLDDAVIIGGYELFTPLEGAGSMRCNIRAVDGYSYHPPINSSCLQRHGYSHQVKNAIMPIMRMYNGLSTQQMKEVETIQFYRKQGPDGKKLRDFTWLSLFTKCVESE